MKTAAREITGIQGIVFTLHLALACFSAGASTWTLVSPSPASQWLRTVEFGNGLFIAGGDTGSRLVSTDGMQWSPRAGDPLEHYLGGTFANGSFWLTGQRFNTDRTSWRGIILNSADGSTWVERHSLADTSFLDMAAGAGRLVAVAGASDGVSVLARVVTSTDGVQWTPASAVGTGFWPYSIAYGNGMFVGVGSSQVFRSADGLAWTVAPTVGATRLCAITFDGSRFIAVGLNGAIATTANGVDWTVQPSPVSQDLWSVHSGNGGYAAAGNDGIIIASENGTSWTAASALGSDLRGLASGAGRFVTAGRFGTIAFSTPGPSGPRLGILAMAGGPRLQIFGTVGRGYRLETTTSLGAPQWNLLQEITSLATNPFMVDDPAGWAPGQGYYRLIELP
jgi:hypothetical protein